MKLQALSLQTQKAGLRSYSNSNRATLNACLRMIVIKQITWTVVYKLSYDKCLISSVTSVTFPYDIVLKLMFTIRVKPKAFSLLWKTAGLLTMFAKRSLHVWQGSKYPSAKLSLKLILLTIIIPQPFTLDGENLNCVCIILKKKHVPEPFNTVTSVHSTVSRTGVFRTASFANHLWVAASKLWSN